MDNQGHKARRFAVLALMILIPVQAGLWLVDSVYPGHQHLVRFLILFGAVKILGDLLYYSLWPHYRHFVQIRHYLAEELIPFYRFGFPASLAQRLMEVTFFPSLAFGLAPSTWAEHAVAGPLLAIGVYLVNRWLVESSQEESRTALRDTTHLP